MFHVKHLNDFILDILDTILDKLWTFWTNCGHSGHDSGHNWWNVNLNAELLICKMFHVKHL